MALWAVFTDRHIEGDRVGLRALSAAASGGVSYKLDLDEPPLNWLVGNRPLSTIRVEPTDAARARIVFRREADVLVLSGRADELGRIVGGAIIQVATGPLRINTVGAHVHLDPTSDPEGRVYGADSIPLVVGIQEDERG